MDAVLFLLMLQIRSSASLVKVSWMQEFAWLRLFKISDAVDHPAEHARDGQQADCEDQHGCAAVHVLFCSCIQARLEGCWNVGTGSTRTMLLSR